MRPIFPDKPELCVSIPASTGLLKMVVELANHMATLNQFSTTESKKIALAIDEAITNVIKHSYKDKMDDDIKLEFYFSPEGLKTKIIFTGVPPVLSQEEMELDKLIKEKKKGGLGVQLMKRIMDSVEYNTSGNINTCEMIKWKKKNLK